MTLGCTNMPPGPNRWDLTSQALTLFFQDPHAADLNVALRFFPTTSRVVRVSWG